jgi:hypothetical protein
LHLYYLCALFALVSGRLDISSVSTEGRSPERFWVGQSYCHLDVLRKFKKQNICEMLIVRCYFCRPNSKFLNIFSSLKMSDVEAGGATVFPQINLSLWPQKGSAAFWFNLHPNGEGDDLTQHAACPVLTGSKWGKIF